MFKKLKEMQGLLNARTKALDSAEERIEALSSELTITRHNNVVLLNKNRKQDEILKQIKNLTEINKYNNEEKIFNKIKELVQTAIEN